MNTMLVCVSLVVLAQVWDRPVIQESELAAPGGVQQDGQPISSNDAGSSWDVDSNDGALAPLTTTPQPPDKEVVTRWEYDDEGRPVARTEERPAQTETTPVAPPREQAASRTEDTKEKRDTGRIATFWLLLPRR